MTARSRRIGLLNRPWSGHWSALAGAPLQVPSVEELRAALDRLADADPTHPLVCRLDSRRGRWTPVPPTERAAHLEVLVRPGGALDLEAVPAYIDRYRPAEDMGLPIGIVLGDTSIVVYLNHQYGDARTFTSVVLQLVRADVDGLRQLEPRVRLGLPLAALLRQSRATYGSWLLRAAAPLLEVLDRSRGKAPIAVHGSASPGRPPTQRAVSGPAAAGVVLDNTQLRGLTRWRNEHAPGASITAVLASRTYTALTRAGVPVSGAGFYSLFDVRTSLGEDAEARFGNLAKSLYLQADLADPAAIDHALRDALTSRRALAALVAGALVEGVRDLLPGADRTRHAVAGPDPREAVLTFNSMPSLPGLDRLPWLGSGPRRYVGVGYPTGAAGISVFAVRFRDRMELNASFDLALASAETVERALAAVADLTVQPPTTGVD